MSNTIHLYGYLGDDAELRGGDNGPVVLRVAENADYTDRRTGEVVKKTIWHQIITFQPGLKTMLLDRGRKGDFVTLEGHLEYDSYRKDGETSDRVTAKIVVGPQHGIKLIEPAR